MRTEKEIKEALDIYRTIEKFEQLNRNSEEFRTLEVVVTILEWVSGKDNSFNLFLRIHNLLNNVEHIFRSYKNE